MHTESATWAPCLQKSNLKSNEQHMDMGSPADVSDVHAASIFRAGFHNIVACRPVKQWLYKQRPLLGNVRNMDATQNNGVLYVVRAEKL
jgi:hypothetical protein